MVKNLQAHPPSTDLVKGVVRSTFFSFVRGGLPPILKISKLTVAGLESILVKTRFPQEIALFCKKFRNFVVFFGIFTRNFCQNFQNFYFSQELGMHFSKNAHFSGEISIFESAIFTDF